jgi:hypothetical protein
MLWGYLKPNIKVQGPWTQEVSKHLKEGGLKGNKDDVNDEVHGESRGNTLGDHVTQFWGWIERPTT